jgi:hypothetical protein
MEIKEYRKNGVSVVEVIADGVIVKRPQDLLDIVSDTSSKRLIIKRENLCEGFFDLKTGVAGEILQKVGNYRLNLGILGDFSDIESKSMRDFIYESNNSRQILFKKTVEEIVRVFCR